VYLDFLQEKVVPLMRQRYRLGGGGTASILGSSLGGILACYAAWRRPAMWPAAACMSSSFWWDDQATPLTAPWTPCA
jgi:predicted alpha/beta superfamily hydrolase